ncbi:MULTISPECIES: glycerophosphodiester phosphodiesterase [unclassified Streptomyces]|uniref:glycerophosphodiester phosphodiesterase n=1 Tax=unclassified Streptomyces TaxID=2593676 RepID=UPI002DD7DE28|nr:MULTISPECIES: glycerophosphodiester phosphodiesterase [unclassified Streptomyces]WSA96493.1 glycerophosphodiester phosphodiesterase [Streptomyces sp. NBC_01795]WSB80905.1 glycerophosphodiester phosphodiesterase [Streptomyces sp. NBC_01775]WSS10884.1 glycerophosphodiester phosphodiesterase [Streptomyces sp. NBC_01186]WSS39580.1 glycerophosphodiester phosphodiesterase [Streptomyces sp. NBC_01187]
MTNVRPNERPSPASLHPFLAHPAPLAFAHRGGAPEEGAGSRPPENTCAAFARAARLGYRYMETDVHATADGALVAFHDATLDRATDGSGPLARLSWAEVSRARVAGSEPVPLFADLLRGFPQARWNVDVKAEAALVPLLDLVAAEDAWARVCVGSFDERRVRRARALAGPRLLTSLGTGGVLGLRMRAFGLPWRLPPGAGCAQVPERHGRVRVVDRSFVRAAHTRGLQVHVWTVNERARAEALLDLGVDGIITDRLEMLREVFERRGAWPQN